MPTKKLVGAAAFTAALAAGGAAGALFGTPALSGAQEAENDTTESTTTAEAPNAEARRAKPDHLATAADALGMTAEELRTELAAGKSIADVAEEKGVDKQKVVDALVAAASARIDEMKADLPARIAEMVERDGLAPGGPGGPGFGGHHRHRHGIVNAIDDAATALDISVQELRDALAAGKSIATVASEKGKSLDDVKAAMIADANARIDRAVENGRLTAEEGAARKAEVAEKVDEIVQREGLPMRGGRGGGGPVRTPDAEAEGANTTA